MGVIASCRCRSCSGTGYLDLDSQQEALYEWVEGFLDPDTDEKWLKDQLERLMKARDQFLSKKGP
jgi:hypothetical protein